MPIEDVISHKRREQETMRGFIEAYCACDIERFLDAAIALTGSDPTVCANQGRWNVDPDQARMPVEQKSVGGCRGSRVGAAHRRSSKQTFGSLNRRAHQAMGEKADERRQMREGFEQFLATIVEQCLDEHDMQLPLVVRTVGDNGSVLVAGFDEGAELVALTKHCENDTFKLPIKITVVSQNNRTARLVIERDGNIGRFH